MKRIVALRGDLPATAMSPSAPGEFHYANELVSFIRETHGDAFKIEVAAYPEMHPAGGRARAWTSSTSAARWRPARTGR